MTRSQPPPDRGDGRSDEPHEHEPGPEPAPEMPAPRGSGARSVLADLALMLGAFVVATLAAEAAGAANLGTALSFGQIGFALAAVYVLVVR